MRRKTRADSLLTTIKKDMFELIRVRPAAVKRAKRKGQYINANGRKYLNSLDDYTSLDNGTTHYFNEHRTQVKRVLNYI